MMGTLKKSIFHWLSLASQLAKLPINGNCVTVDSNTANENANYLEL